MSKESERETPARGLLARLRTSLVGYDSQLVVSPLEGSPRKGPRTRSQPDQLDLGSTDGAGARRKRASNRRRREPKAQRSRQIKPIGERALDFSVRERARNSARAREQVQSGQSNLRPRFESVTMPIKL